MASPYSDPVFMQLGDFLNARVKMRHGALSHIITARILDGYPTGTALQKLVDNPHQIDQLSDQIAKEVYPGGVNTGAGATHIPVQYDAEPKLPTLPRNNSWSDLLKYGRD